MSYINGVNLIPGTGEFGYDNCPYTRAKTAASGGFATLNLNICTGRRQRTNYSYAIDQLQGGLTRPATTVALVVSWFGNSLDAREHARFYPSTTFIGGAFRKLVGGTGRGCLALLRASRKTPPA